MKDGQIPFKQPAVSIETDSFYHHGMAGRIAKNSFVIFAGKIIEISSSLIIMMMLARILQPSLYGDFALINAIVLSFQPLINLEINTILIREMAADRNRERVLLGGGMLLKAILVGAFIVSAIVLDRIIQFNPVLRAAFFLSVVAEIFQQIVWVYNTVFMARERMEYEPLLSLISKVISVGGIGLLAVFMSHEAMETTGFVLVFGIISFSQFVRAVLGMVIASKFLKRFRIQWSLPVAKELFVQSRVMGLATFFTGLSLRIDVYFLKYFKSSEQIALFHIPHMFALQIQILAISLVTALFPVFSRLRASNDDADRFRIAQDLSIRIMTLVGLSVTLFSSFYPNLIIRILGGQAYDDSIPVMVILSWCIPMLFLNYLGANLLTAMKKQNVLIYGAVTSLLINAGLDLLWIPAYGILGASFATVISYFVQLLTIFFFLHRYSRDPLDIIRAIAIPALLSMAGVSGVWLLQKTPEVRSIASAGLRAFVLIVILGISTAIQPESFRRSLKRVCRSITGRSRIK
jgi:O-antigen/teichoic acid export membrane protein